MIAPPWLAEALLALVGLVSCAAAAASPDADARAALLIGGVTLLCAAAVGDDTRARWAEALRRRDGDR